MTRLALLTAAIALSGCATGVGEAIRASDARERACRGAYAERLGLPMSAIEVDGGRAGPEGAATLPVRSVDGRDSASCRVGAGGEIISIAAPA